MYEPCEGEVVGDVHVPLYEEGSVIVEEGKMKIKLTHYSFQTKEIYEFHKLNKFMNVNTEQRFFRERRGKREEEGRGMKREELVVTRK